MHKERTRNGFTLIELTLSLTFISVLSLAVVLIVMNSVAAYHRGVVLNQVNTTGMEVVDDMRAAIQNAPARSMTDDCSAMYSDASGTNLERCKTDRGHNFVSMVRTASVKIRNTNYSNVPVYGAVCTGSYSYIWNSGYFFGTDASVQSGVYPAGVKYRKGSTTSTIGGSTKAEFKLLKIHDEERAICKSVNSSDYVVGKNNFSNVFDISGTTYNAIDEDPLDVLQGSTSLALYDLASATPADSTSLDKVFYTTTFILGTIQGGINVMASGNFCTTPGDMANASVEAFNYCAINKFNFAAEANGG